MAINNVSNGVQKAPLDNNKVSNQQNQAVTQQTNAAKQLATSTTAKADSVSLTQSAQQLNQVQKKSADAPVNQEKVDKLKKAIQNGEYKIDAQSLAKKIARLESEVFGLKSDS